MGNPSKEGSYDGPEFMQFYVASMCSQVSRLPPGFAEKYGNVPQITTIEGNGGRSWPIVVRKVDGDFFFQDGWPEFVKDNSLEELDILTFVYSDSKFYVEIYGRSGIQKFIPTCSKNSKEQPHNQTVLSGKFTCNQAIPEFEVTLNNTYLTKCLNVPQDFSQRYLKPYCDSYTYGSSGRKAIRKVILQNHNKSWEVHACKSGPRFQFSRGWVTFVTENLLELGDHCKFELIKRDPFVLKVTITKVF